MDYKFSKNHSSIKLYSSEIRPGNLTGESDLRCLAYRNDASIQFKITYLDEWQKLPRRQQNCNDKIAVPQLYDAPPKTKYEAIYECKGLIYE